MSWSEGNSGQQHQSVADSHSTRPWTSRKNTHDRLTWKRNRIISVHYHNTGNISNDWLNFHILKLYSSCNIKTGIRNEQQQSLAPVASEWSDSRCCNRLFCGAVPHWALWTHGPARDVSQPLVLQVAVVVVEVAVVVVEVAVVVAEVVDTVAGPVWIQYHIVVNSCCRDIMLT